MGSFIYATIPEEMVDTVNNRFLDVLKILEPHQKAMLDAGFDDYKKRCGIGEAILPYHIWTIVMYESYLKEAR